MDTTTIYDFPRTESCFQPAAFIRGTDNTFYGVTPNAETFDNELYRLTPGGDYQVLHVFDFPDDPDGYQACGGVVQGRDGALYGTTTQGGEFDRGVVYRVALDGSYSKLHDFAADEAQVMVRLTKAADGMLYGITGGAAGGASVIFKLTLDVTAPTVRVTANGSDLPITVAPGAPLKIDIMFDAPGAQLASANVGIGFAAPFGLLWLGPTGFTTTPALIYSGPLPDFGPVRLFDFATTTGFPAGTYQWFMIVHDPATTAISYDIIQTNLP